MNVYLKHMKTNGVDEMKKIWQRRYAILLIYIFLIAIYSNHVMAMKLHYDGKTHNYTAKPISLVVNGQTINTEMPSIILNDRTMVPVRGIFEELGATVRWSSRQKLVTVIYKDTRVKLTIDSTKAYVNNEERQLDVPAKLINDSTMIPAAFVARELGFKVNWNNTERTVSIREKTQADNAVVLGYATYYTTSDKSSYNSIVRNQELLDQVITHTYTVDGKGNLKGLIPKAQLDFAKKNGIEIKASVSNQFDIKVAKELLSSSANRKNLINNIIKEIEQYGYSGICIDIEHVYPSNRNDMTKLMKEVYGNLNPKGYKVTVALPAKTYDDKKGSWSGAFDYNALSDYADQFVLMTYDEHYPQGEPGSIASIGWVDKVLKYATKELAEDKIFIGLAAYGYDWSKGNAKAYTISKAYKIAEENKATVQWDEKSKSAYYKYTKNGVKHEVWFENEDSIEAKLELVKKYNLKGVSIWALGYETDKYMNAIKLAMK